MPDKPIIFSGPMVRALLDGRKTQTRRILKPQPGVGIEYLTHDRRRVRTASASDYPIGADVPEVMTMKIVPYAPGDRLWVRERWGVIKAYDGLSPRKIGMRHFYDGRYHGSVGYVTDPPSRWCQAGCNGAAGKWRSPIHMPRWASRLTLVVTDVRVQRVQEISEEDARAEGITSDHVECADGVERQLWFGVPQAGYEFAAGHGPIQAFSDLWDSINNPRGLCADDAPRSWHANPFVVALTFTVHHQNIDAMEKNVA